MEIFANHELLVLEIRRNNWNINTISARNDLAVEININLPSIVLLMMDHRSKCEYHVKIRRDFVENSSNLIYACFKCADRAPIQDKTSQNASTVKNFAMHHLGLTSISESRQKLGYFHFENYL